MKLDNISLTPRQLRRRENYFAHMNARKNHQRFRLRLNRRRKIRKFRKLYLPGELHLSYRGHIKKSFDSRFLLMKLGKMFNIFFRIYEKFQSIN